MKTWRIVAETDIVE